MNILGPSRVSIEAGQAWARKRNSHDRFVRVAEFYWRDCPRYGIPPEIAYVQAGHETGWGHYGGVVPPDAHNWCGLKTLAGGGNNDPAAHARFPNDATGVLAHIQHLARYAGYGGPAEGDWIVDPRWTLVKPGSAPTVEELGGKWAPAATYGTGLVKLVEDIRSFANDGSWNVAGDDSRFTWMPDVTEWGYPQGTRGRNGRAIDLGIVHYTQGTDSSGWLRGNNGSSTHYLTDRAMRPREQHVREADAAWTAGNREYNLRGINVEGELPGDQWTPELIRELARTTYPIWKRNNIPLVYLGRDNGPGKRGLIGHADVPNQDHTDPGATFDWPLYISELQALDGQPAPEPPPPDPLTPNPSVPDHHQDNPYGDFWIPTDISTRMIADETQCGFLSVGYVVGGAFVEDDKLVVYTERRRYERHRDGRIYLGLVGLEVFNERKP